MTHTSQEYGAIFIDSLHSRATSRDLSSAEYMAPFFKVDVAFYFWLVRGWSLFWRQTGSIIFLGSYLTPLT